MALAIASGAAAPVLAQQIAPPPPAPPPASEPLTKAPNALPGDPFGEEVTLTPKTIIYLKGNSTWDKALDNRVEAGKSVYPLRNKQGIKRAGPAMTIYTQADDTGFQFQAAVPIAEEPKELPKGEKYTEKQTEMKKEMAGTLPLIENEMTGILTGKTSAELMSTDGKQKLRDELKLRVNKALEKVAHDPKERQEILSVYFSDFIIQ